MIWLAMRSRGGAVAVHICSIHLRSCVARVLELPAQIVIASARDPAATASYPEGRIEALHVRKGTCSGPAREQLAETLACDAYHKGRIRLERLVLRQVALEDGALLAPGRPEAERDKLLAAYNSRS